MYQQQVGQEPEFLIEYEQPGLYFVRSITTRRVQKVTKSPTKFEERRY
jgi:hypothetical protein